MDFHVYIMRLADGRLYVGHTNDLARRLTEHQASKGCRTSSLAGVGEMIYTEQFPDRISAVRRERQIKGWSRGKKLALSCGVLSTLHQLSRSRGP